VLRFSKVAISMSRNSPAAFFILSVALPSMVICLKLQPFEGDMSGLQEYHALKNLAIELNTIH